MLRFIVLPAVLYWGEGGGQTKSVTEVTRGVGPVCERALGMRSDDERSDTAVLLG